MDNPCANCGQCCVEMDTPPFNYFEEPDKTRFESLPAALVAEIEAETTRPYGSPCLWYDAQTRRCKHYDLRPEVCRTYTPGVRSCNSRRVELGLVALPHVDAWDEDGLPAGQPRCHRCGGTREVPAGDGVGDVFECPDCQ